MEFLALGSLEMESTFPTGTIYLAERDFYGCVCPRVLGQK